MCNCKKNRSVSGARRTIVKSPAGSSPSNPIRRTVNNINSGRRIITRTIK